MVLLSQQFLRVNISFTEYEADSEWAYNSDTDRIERRSGSFFP